MNLSFRFANLADASLYAIPVYQRLGFGATGTPQTSDGVTFQRMVCARGK